MDENKDSLIDNMDQQEFKEQAKDKKLTLHCFGDSYTAGHGLVPYRGGMADNKMIWDFFDGKHKEDYFPEQIQRLTSCFRPDGIRVVARGGAGNLEILQAVIKSIPLFAPADQVIIGATNADRFLLPARPKRSSSQAYNEYWNSSYYTDAFQWMSGDCLPAMEFPVSNVASTYERAINDRMVDKEGKAIYDELQENYIEQLSQIVDWADMVTKEDLGKGGDILKPLVIVQEHLLRTVAKYISTCITPNVILWGSKMWMQYQTITEWTKDHDNPIEDIHWSPYGHQLFANTITPFILKGYHEIGLER